MTVSAEGTLRLVQPENPGDKYLYQKLPDGRVVRTVLRMTEDQRQVGAHPQNTGNVHTHTRTHTHIPAPHRARR